MPSPVLARHVAAMLRGPLGVPVVIGTTHTRGLLDERGSIDPEGVGEGIAVERVLTLARAEAVIPQNTAITVDDVAYVTRTPPLPTEDGGLVRYGLALAAPGDGTV